MLNWIRVKARLLSSQPVVEVDGLIGKDLVSLVSFAGDQHDVSGFAIWTARGWPLRGRQSQGLVLGFLRPARILRMISSGSSCLGLSHVMIARSERVRQRLPFWGACGRGCRHSQRR